MEMNFSKRIKFVSVCLIFLGLLVQCTPVLKGRFGGRSKQVTCYSVPVGADVTIIKISKEVSSLADDREVGLAVERLTRRTPFTFFAERGFRYEFFVEKKGYVTKYSAYEEFSLPSKITWVLEREGAEAQE